MTILYKAKQPMFTRLLNLLMAVCFLTLSVTHSANGQSIATQKAQLNIRTDNGVTNKTVNDKVRQDTLGNIIKAWGNYSKNIYDSLLSAGGGSDSTIFATNYRVDTAKKKIRDTIAAITLDRAAMNGATTYRNITMKGGYATPDSLSYFSFAPFANNISAYNNGEIKWNIAGTGSGAGSYGYIDLYGNNSGSNYRFRIRAPFGSVNSTATLRSGDGTIAYTSDTANTVQVADSNVMVPGGYLTPAYWNTNKATVTAQRGIRVTGGPNYNVGIDSSVVNTSRQRDSATAATPTIIHNSAFAYGTSGINWGSSDSSTTVQYLNNKVVDSMGTSGVRLMRNNYGAAPGEAVLQIKNKLTYGGLDQTQSVLLGVGTGTISNNNAFIAFGTSMASLNTILSQSQFNFASMKLASTYNGTTPVVWYGAGGTTTANNGINITLNTYNGSGANVPTSGTLSILTLGLNSGTSATFAPTTGTAKKYSINDVSVINQTGSANGVTASYANDGITLTAAADYRAFYATNNTGRAFYSGGTATSSLAGKLTVGTVTDNGTDALQVSGSTNLDGAVKITAGSNKALNTGTLSGGTATISNTTVTANSKIFLQYYGAVTNAGSLTVSSVSAGTSFTVTSTNASDANTFWYFIIN